jgi:hypothetical protein
MKRDHVMQMRRLTQIPGMTLAVMLVLVVAPGLVFGPEAQAEGGGIEGTWLNEVKIVSCDAPDTVLATFQSMTTYMRGGILIEGGAPPAPPPAVSHSAGHGIWERTGGHTFRLFFRAQSFDSLGRPVTITEVENQPSLIEGVLIGNGTNRITNLNPDGMVLNVTHGCNHATSQRLVFEDLSED